MKQETPPSTSPAELRTPNGHDGRKLRALARLYDWRLVLLFGSAARGGTARDIDLAVLPGHAPTFFEQAHWQGDLQPLFAPFPVDLVLIDPALSPLTRYEIFRHGVCLFEASPGLFGQEWDRTFFLHADSEHFRRFSREMLHA